jgi:P63C domain
VAIVINEETEMDALRETHSGVWRLGELELPCAVLNNGKRVISGKGLPRTFGYNPNRSWTSVHGDGVDVKLPTFLASEGLRPFISSELELTLNAPLTWRSEPAGLLAFGYEATILPDLCDVLISAFWAGALRSNQRRMADAAKALLQGFAKVGIIAIVDEVTGYQQDRHAQELQRLISLYLAEWFSPWIKRFPDGLWGEIAELYRKPIPTTQHRAKYMGRFVADHIYAFLPADVMAEMRSRNPLDEHQHRKYRHHQALNDDVGHPLLHQRIENVRSLIRASLDEGIDKFKRLIEAHDIQLGLRNGHIQPTLGLD